MGPLKALISYDALVHPDHPLRKPGQDGIELYIGEMAIIPREASHLTIHPIRSDIR